MIAGQRFWRIPVMEGEFLVAESVGVGEGRRRRQLVIVAGRRRRRALAAAEAAVEAMRGEGDRAAVPGRHRAQRQQGRARSRPRRCPPPPTIQFAPTLRAQVDDSLLPDGVGSVFEIVIDGVSEDAVREAMRRGLHAAAAARRAHVTAANFGGKLGQFHFPLSELRDPP